ncbi:MAG: hypothetical protein AMJ89_00660 [candidate division Zixibacteria bacterium SM23_73]|nr:MAG: hypothetical protein AMJ89_00660 [candidate division Zixibacteria bacterium SM23_73]
MEKAHLKSPCLLAAINSFEAKRRLMGMSEIKQPAAVEIPDWPFPIIFFGHLNAKRSIVIE